MSVPPTPTPSAAQPSERRLVIVMDPGTDDEPVTLPPPARAPTEASSEKEGPVASPPPGAEGAGDVPPPPAITSLPPEDLHEDLSVPPPPAASASAAPSRGVLFFAFALLVGVVGAVLHMASRQDKVANSTGAHPMTTSSGAAVTSAPSAPTSTTSATTSTAGVSSRSPAPASDDLPLGTSVPPGFGVLEITLPADGHVRVDGNEAGAGPLSSTVLRAGYHQVRVDQNGHQTQYVIEVRAGKTTRVMSTPLP
jgi:hypothetical protein